MSDKAQLNIYGHYNETGVPLIAMKRGIGEYLDDGINIGMTTFGSGKNVNRIEVRLDGNKNAKVFDHANEIKNIFSHEGQHVKDIRNGVIYSREQAEQRAILTQMSHPTFLRTRPIFQNTVMKYGIRFGMKFD